MIVGLQTSQVQKRRDCQSTVLKFHGGGRMIRGGKNVYNGHWEGNDNKNKAAK